MKRALPILALLAASVAAPAGASAQVPQPPAPAPTQPAPAPAPANGRLSIKAEKVGGRSAQVLAGERWRVRGTLRPYVAGQVVTVRFTRGRRKLLAKQVAVQPSGGGTVGTFRLGFSTQKAGRVTVRASHRATPELVTLRATARRVTVLAPRARPGTRGAVVRLLQARLSSLGYVVGARGLFDARTARAVLAFRKVAGMSRTTAANRDLFRRIARGGGRFKIRFPSHGRHVEASIGHQVIALIDGGRVQRIYPVSSGKPSTPTVRGHFRVYRKDFGTNSHGMVHSSYFIGGYAIHGYVDVPAYNASHGCLRVPIPDALAIFHWVRYGTPVDVYA